MLFPKGEASVRPYVYISVSFKVAFHFILFFPLLPPPFPNHRPQTTERISSDSLKSGGMLTDQDCRGLSCYSY